MKGEIKVIDNVYPVTRAEAVYIDNSKTLKTAIENGELGGSKEVSLNGRGYPIFCLREYIQVIPVPTSKGVGHEFITKGITNFVRLPSGSHAYVGLPSSVKLGVGQSYVFNFANMSYEVRGTSGTNEYTACSSNEVILYSNYGGVPQGLLKDWFKECIDENIVISEKVAEVSNIKTSQGIFIVDNYLYTTAHSNDEHTDFAHITKYDISTNKSVKIYTHNLGHLNSCDYSSRRDMLLTGNSSKSYTLIPEMFIFKNWRSVLENNTTLDFNTLEKTVIQFAEFEGEYKWNFAWDSATDNIVWASCCDMRILRKIKLGTDDEGNYDGTYVIERTWYSEQSDIIGGIIHVNGNLYAGVKGSYGIRKLQITNGNMFKSEYIHPVGKFGDMQGVAIYENKLICVSDGNTTKIDIDKL